MQILYLKKFTFSICRTTIHQEAPLFLRHLLWLQDNLFVAVSKGLVPTSSALIVLCPSQDTEADTLSVRYCLKRTLLQQ